MTARDGYNTPTISQWSDIPLEILRAELARRENTNEASRPTCGSKSQALYNTPIHVFALFLILFLSIAACAFPIIARRFPKFPVPHRFLFISRHFGTGVLIATAFVHLFPTAYVSLTNPCLPPFWNRSYPAMSGFIAMTSVFIVVGIEMFFASRGARHVHGSEYDKFVLEEDAEREHEHADGIVNGHPKPTSRRSESFRRFRDDDGKAPEIALADMPGSSESLITSSLPVSERPSPPVIPTAAPLFDADAPQTIDQDPSQDETLHRSLSLSLSEVEPDDADVDANALPSHANTTLLPTATHHHRNPSTSTRPLSPTSHRRALLQCLLLEAGILFHSIFIGLALSISTGPPFVVLLIAISLHQTFEGLALGSRIAALAFAHGSVKPWIMTVAYGATTPVGQAIGLAVRGLYDPQSETGLLMVGVMNAVSTGLLLFAGLVELLAEDFLSAESYRVLRGQRRVEACAAVVGGSMLMALVGAWA